MQQINADPEHKQLLNDLLFRNMLPMAEDLFGPRDSSYTIHGIEFVSDGPYIWYPIKGQQDIIIRLGFLAAKDLSFACYQMAHETIHLLAPTGGQNANNFEEGVACYFAAYYMKNLLNQPDWRPDLPSYKRALKRVAPLLDADIDCVQRLRKQEPSFSKMGNRQMSTAFPNLTPNNVDFLISKFNRNSN